MDLTIIVPHFNTPYFLRRLLNSIPKDKDLEVIIVDDRSTKYLDEYDELKSSFSTSQFIYKINHREKKGAGTCRNIGLSFAKGKWCLFADADDFFEKDFYHKISPYFESDNEVVFFRPKSVDGVTFELAQRHIHLEKILSDYQSENNLRNEMALRYKVNVPWSKLIKREFIEENNIQFDEVMHSNDMMFSTKLGFYMKRFETSNEVIYIATRNSGSLTTQATEESFFIRLNVFIDKYRFLKAHLSKKDFKETHLSASYLLVIGMKYKLSVVVILKAVLLLLRNKVNIFNSDHLSIMFLYKNGLRHMRKYKKEKKFYTNG